MAKAKNKEEIPIEIVEKHAIVENIINKHFAFLKQLGYTFKKKIVSDKFFKLKFKFNLVNKKFDRDIYFSYIPLSTIDKKIEEENIFSLLIFRKIDMKLRDYGDDISMPFYFNKYRPNYNREKLEIDYYEGTFEQKVEGVIKEYAHLLQTDFKEVIEGKAWIEGASLNW